MMRRWCCAVVVAMIWILLFGWAASLRWNTQLLPQQRLTWNASDFHVVMGAGVEDGSALRVGAIGDDGNALQAIPLEHLHAEDFSLLRYRFEGFPRTLELSLVFRSADAPDDVQDVTLPWPGDGWRSVDLHGIAAWRGDIIEFGFHEYATPQIAPPSTAFQPFRFDKAGLWSSSWRGGLAAMYTSWFGETPWALMSISALGAVRQVAQAPSLTPLLAIGAIFSLLAAALILRWSRPRLLRNGAIMALALWALLDLRWLVDFSAKHELTEAVYAGKPWSEREHLVPDQDTALAAEQVRNWLATQPPVRRILVDSDSTYTLLRLIYLLLPLDVAPMQQTLGQAPNVRLPGDAMFLMYASSQWHYDAERGVLVSGAQGYAVEPVFESGDIHVYRPRGAKP